MAAEKEWPVGQTFEFQGLNVSLSAPVLVARSKGYFWFPTAARLANGDVIAAMSACADVHVSATVMLISRSKDGGRTWGEPMVAIDAGPVIVNLPSGEAIMLPYYLRPKPGGMGNPCNRFPADGTRFAYQTRGVGITGFPKPDKSFAPELGISGFVFNGQSIRLKDNTNLATLYGGFAGDSRSSLVAVSDAADGVSWKFRSVIAGPDCELKGADGPCESALCRLKDGRIMCVFRLANNIPYGQTFSSDEGKTWTKPVAMDGVFAVEPSLQVMKDGVVALSGGSANWPGLFLWFNPDGTGTKWQKVDILAHHNKYCTTDPIKNTSSYTELVALDETHLLYIYDRLAVGWDPIPDDMADTNSVWVVTITLSK